MMSFLLRVCCALILACIVAVLGSTLASSALRSSCPGKGSLCNPVPAGIPPPPPAARQALVPGVGYVNETTTTQQLIPGLGYINEGGS